MLKGHFCDPSRHLQESLGPLGKARNESQGGSRTELEPETGTVGTVFPETESGTGTAGTVFQEPKPEPEPSFPVKLY